MQVVAERILPIHTAADRIRRLAIGEPLDVLHHHDQRQAPRGHFHGTPRGRIQIGEQLIVIEAAKLGAELHIKVALGEGGVYSGHRRLWNRR
jgi:hypothetical protein